MPCPAALPHIALTQRSARSVSSAPARIALLGPNADAPEALMGCYSFANHVLAHHPEVPLGFELPSVLEAVRAEFAGADVVHERGCDVEGDDRSGRLPRARVIRPADEPPEFPPDADDEGHYIPPPPPPLPSADPLTKGAWIALIGGPVYLLVTVILDWEVPGWAAFLAVAAFIGGFVTLVLRMGDEPRDPDDGAVV